MTRWQAPIVLLTLLLALLGTTTSSVAAGPLSTPARHVDYHPAAQVGPTRTLAPASGPTPPAESPAGRLFLGVLLVAVGVAGATLMLRLMRDLNRRARRRARRPRAESEH